MRKWFVLFLAVGLVLGGGAGLAYAAQGSLPAEPLYAVKLVTEDLQLAFAGDPAAKVDVLTELAGRRVQEMVALANKHQAAQPAVADRLQSQLNQALAAAAGLDDPRPALNAIQRMAAAAAPALEAARQAAPDDPSLLRAEQTLVQAWALTQAGLTDMQQFRNQMQAGYPMEGTGPTRMPGAAQQSGMMTDTPATRMPGASAMPGQRNTAMPGAGATLMLSAMPNPNMPVGAPMSTDVPPMMATVASPMVSTAVPPMMSTTVPPVMDTVAAPLMPSLTPDMGGAGMMTPGTGPGMMTPGASGAGGGSGMMTPGAPGGGRGMP